MTEFRRLVAAAVVFALLQTSALAQSGRVYDVGLITSGAPDTAIQRPGTIPIVVTNSGDPVDTGLVSAP
ncbi:MAG: hypothetical protein WA633_06300 [Stellaceae bacterium]